jgi:hypothetical protein
VDQKNLGGKMNKGVQRAVMIGLAATFAASGLFAQARGVTGPDGVVRDVPTSSSNEQNSGFGSGLFFEMIPAENFNPSSSSTVYSTTAGYVYRSGVGGSHIFAAGLPLKNQRLSAIRLFYSDTNLDPNQNPTLYLCRLFVTNTTGVVPVYECPYFVAGDDVVNGFGAISMDPDKFITATEELNAGQAGAEEVKWIVAVGIPTMDGTIGFSGVRMTWKREVSPAPLTATFGDVPVGSGLHKFVEALYAAGITGGCGGGNFCPQNTLTRGQMAIFLATALGLHYAP